MTENVQRMLEAIGAITDDDLKAIAAEIEQVKKDAAARVTSLETALRLAQRRLGVETKEQRNARLATESRGRNLGAKNTNGQGGEAPPLRALGMRVVQLRKKLAQGLLATGAMPLASLPAFLASDPKDTEMICNSPWFHVEDGRVRITPEGRQQHG